MIVLNSPARGSAFNDSQYRCRVMLAIAAFTMLSAACTNDGDASNEAPASVEDRRAIMEKETKDTSPRRAPSNEAETVQGSGEVPPQLLAIFQDDLARRALVKHDTITVVSSTEQQWSDGAMGCPQPGMMYTQMIVPGYRVVLRAGGDKYSYHSDRRGNFIVCSNGLSFPPVKEQVKGTKPAE